MNAYIQPRTIRGRINKVKWKVPENHYLPCLCDNLDQQHVHGKLKCAAQVKHLTKKKKTKYHRRDINKKP